jgi:hypothetical protein
MENRIRSVLLSPFSFSVSKDVIAARQWMMSGGPIGARLRATRFGEISPEPWRRRTLVRHMSRIGIETTSSYFRDVPCCSVLFRG